MPTRSERGKEKKFRRTPGGRVKVSYGKAKSSKQSCALCGRQLQGVPHSTTSTERKVMAKSRKRPEVLFGGVLCTACRDEVIQETVMVKHGMKKEAELPIKMRAYVAQASGKVE